MVETLFFDLHGVIVNTPKIFKKYKQITVDHLMECFNLDLEQATKRYDLANKNWEDMIFPYLKDPNTPKTGKKFLQFLDRSDYLFVNALYDGFNLDKYSEANLRERPFEYQVSKKVEALYPEVRETLNQLCEIGYELIIASSSHTSHIKGILRGNLIEDLFEEIIGFDTVAATKHTPNFYEGMLNFTKSPRENCIMIGNSLHEITVPKQIGMKTIHINRERKIPQHIIQMADLSTADLRDFPKKIEQVCAN